MVSIEHVELKRDKVEEKRRIFHSKVSPSLRMSSLVKNEMNDKKELNCFWPIWAVSISLHPLRFYSSDKREEIHFITRRQGRFFNGSSSPTTECPIKGSWKCPSSSFHRLSANFFHNFMAHKTLKMDFSVHSMGGKRVFSNFQLCPAIQMRCLASFSVFFSAPSASCYRVYLGNHLNKH